MPLVSLVLADSEFRHIPLKNVQLDPTGNRLRFDFLYDGTYGPLRYDPERVTPPQALSSPPVTIVRPGHRTYCDRSSSFRTPSSRSRT